jgi:transposase-like protein
MRELTVAERKYQPVLAVISDGLSISQVAGKVGVSRQTLHAFTSDATGHGMAVTVDKNEGGDGQAHADVLRF